MQKAIAIYKGYTFFHVNEENFIKHYEIFREDGSFLIKLSLFNSFGNEPRDELTGYFFKPEDRWGYLPILIWDYEKKTWLRVFQKGEPLCCYSIVIGDAFFHKVI